MASTETITFESHPGWTLQARFFRDVTNAEEVGNLIVAGKLPTKTSVINAKLVPGERELRNRKERRKESARKGASSIPVGSRCSPESKTRRPPPLALAILFSKTRRPSPSHPPPAVN